MEDKPGPSARLHFDWAQYKRQAQPVGSGHRILIVDDDESTCRSLTLIFGKKGYETETAGTGREAMEKAQGRFFDLALLDIRLPDMEGIELLAPLKEMHPDMAMIIVTGYASLETAVQTLNEGASGYITKPLNIDEVLATVREALEKQRLVMENMRLLQEVQRELDERKRAEEEVRLLQTMTQAISESQDFSAALGVTIRRVCVATGWNYGEAWIPSHDASALECAPAWYSSAPEKLQKFRHVTEEFRFQPNTGLPGRVWSSKEAEWIPDVSATPEAFFLRARVAEETGLKAGFGVPIITGEDVLAVLTFFMFESREEDKRLVDLVSAVATQLGSVIQRKRAEEELRQSYEKLRRTLEGTVYALASTAEKRDPYTAGHQQRVTRLACAMAQEMGLPEEQIEGIRVAGTLHDIGKIYVPAEILNKPGRLTEMEMGLIKAHPQVGYDILKTIEFPWPVAQIVLQHHERIDGSGYPQRLSGEEILLEARILAVADVVEAMSSHRPYRPAHGIDKALEEISQNRDVLYDPEVVDACLKLFTEKGFKFE